MLCDLSNTQNCSFDLKKKLMVCLLINDQVVY